MLLNVFIIFTAESLPPAHTTRLAAVRLVLSMFVVWKMKSWFDAQFEFGEDIKSGQETTVTSRRCPEFTYKTFLIFVDLKSHKSKVLRYATRHQSRFLVCENLNGLKWTVSSRLVLLN